MTSKQLENFLLKDNEPKFVVCPGSKIGLIVQWGGDATLGGELALLLQLPGEKEPVAVLARNLGPTECPHVLVATHGRAAGESGKGCWVGMRTEIVERGMAMAYAGQGWGEPKEISR